MVYLDRCSIVCLSHIWNVEEIPIYPGDPKPTVKTIATIESEGFYLQEVNAGEHTGTHWGAPAHFNAGEATADQLVPEDFFLPAIKIDIRHQVVSNPDYELTINDVVNWQNKYGKIPPQCAVLLHTGWDIKLYSSKLNLDVNTLHHPGFSVEVVEWFLHQGILGERGALGTDAFSPDVGNDTTYKVSKLLYQKHRISLELLANLDAIPYSHFYIMVGGNIHKNGSGSPATIYALF